MTSLPYPPTPPGWYPDGQGATRYWDGSAWTAHVAQPSPTFAAPVNQGPPLPGWQHGRQETSPTSGTSGTNTLAVVAIVLGVIGTAIAVFTQVSLVSGMSTVWIGMAIALGGLVMAFAARARTGLKIVCAILAALAVASAVYDNHQLDNKRREISDIFNN
jgi:hypothetical protein